MDKRTDKKSGNPTSSKICSVCAIEKPINDFYSKGSRTDSACKKCTREKKRTKYVADKNTDVAAGLTTILEITTHGLRKRIRSEIEKLDEVILCLQKPKR